MTDDEGTESTESTEGDESLGDPGKKALAEERRARRVAEKGMTDLQTQFDALKQSTQTEQERAVDEARTTAVTEATGPLTLANARLEVALDKGLTKTQAARLIGTTAAELVADADRFLEEIGQQAPKTPPFQGGTRTTPEKKSGMNDLIRQQAGLGS